LIREYVLFKHNGYNYSIMAYKLNPFTGLLDAKESISFQGKYTQPKWVVAWSSLQDWIDLHFWSIRPSLEIELDPNNYLREKWVVISNPKITTSITLGQNPESDIEKIEFFRWVIDDDNLIHDWTDEEYTDDGTDITEKQIYTVRITDEEEREWVNYEIYDFVYPIFYWVAAAWDITDWITEDDVKDLWKVHVFLSYNWTKTFYSSPDSERFIYLLPTSYWELSSIIDKNWYETIDDYNKSTITIKDMKDWNDVDYYYYELNNDTTQDDFKNTFKT